MAVPAYTSDLTAKVINTCESNTTPLVWTNLGTGADATETDYFIQGSACISKPFNITAGGLYCDNTTGITFVSGECYWAWYYFGCPNALLSETNGGLQALIGSSGTAYDRWDVLGNDTYTYGGWRCIPIDPINVGYDDRTSTPSGTRQVFGVYCQTSAGISKGNPLGIDVLRRGRGEMRITGGSVGDGYSTFTGFATQNDNSSNRWGLLQVIDGGYLWQGMMLFGLSTLTTTYRARNTSVATLTTSTAHGLVIGDTVVITGVGDSNYNVTTTVSTVPSTTTFTYANAYANESSTADTGGSINAPTTFVDTNKNILIANTKKVLSTFNAIEVRNASSSVSWTGINISALGTVSKGMFTAVDNATIAKTNCVFTDMGAFTYKSNSTLTNVTFRRCGLVTQNSATISGCRFDNATGAVALLSNNPAAVTGSTFVSDGTGHAIEISTAGTYALSGCTFTGYASTGTPGTSGNEVIYNNSNGEVIINASNCVGTITYKNGSGASTTVNQTITLTLTGLVSGSDIVILDAGTTTERVNVNENTGSTYAYGYTDSGSNIDVCVFKAGYVPFFIRGYTLSATAANLPCAQVADRNYSNP